MNRPDHGRARGFRCRPRVLFEGQWIAGQVAWQDRQGVLLVSDSDEPAVVRLAGVSAVKVHAWSPVMPVIDRVAATPV